MERNLQRLAKMCLQNLNAPIFSLRFLSPIAIYGTTLVLERTEPSSHQ